MHLTRLFLGLAVTGLVLTLSSCSDFSGAISAAGESFILQIGLDTQGSSAAVLDVSGGDLCEDVTHDSSGNSYCAGWTDSDLAETSNGNEAFVVKVDSSGEIVEANGPADSDTIVLKYNSAGVLQWVRQFGTTTITDPDYDYASPYGGVSVSSDGWLYIAGIAGGDFAENGGGSEDIFIAKMNTNGSF